MSLPVLPLLLHRPSDALRRALHQEGVPAADWPDAPTAGRLVLWDGSAHPRPALAEGQTAIDLASLRGPDGDVLAALTDERSARRGWRVGGLEVVEEVARIDKQAARRQFVARLRMAVEDAGGVWLRLAAFPFPYRSAFNFRFDHDEYVREDFDAVLEAIRGHEEATTHYVCASPHAGHPAALARLRGLDVGGHGWWHHTYRDASDNLSNIRRGFEALDAAGLAPRGFAAPHGRWNPGLAEALDVLDVEHSSEFGQVYDDWPSQPPVGRALQMPVHPVCLGIALEAAQRQQGQPNGPTAADAAAWIGQHFRQVIVDKHRAGEPIFLYGHPDGRLGRFSHVLRETLAAAARLPDCWRTTHTRFAAWWRARLQARIAVVEQGDELVVRVGNAPRDHMLALECWQGDHVAVVPLDRPAVRFQPAALRYETRPADDTSRGEPLAESPGVRQRVRRLLDWERVTPLDELRGDTVRGWLKKSLRRWRDDSRSTKS